ncbi:FimV/HubP family polar landmark protein [Marinobacter sp. DUT-1]|uniref:FimV/HubP family polar landmark protein n=1 Tax=Marinobacter sp. DUT-1 TaxID=3412037 RepID=UPI003D180BB5
MKVRKLAVALALAGGLGSGVAQALGLGEIELQSYLNEPLDAEIVLPQSRGVSPGDVLVNIASDTAYERVGLDRNQFLSKLRFEVVTGTDGNLVVNVSSREPLREPYLNFLLELTWPNGRLMREYAVLVDPPVYAEDSGVREQVAAPSSTTRTSEPAAQPTRSSESIRRQAEAESSLGRGYSADTFGPTGPSDTLWTIASRVRPDNSVSMQQVMLAIQDLNPDAFIGGNINRLKRGEVLRVPTRDQIQTRTRAEATRIVSQQNQEFQSPQRTVDATPTPQQTQPTEQAATAGGDAELKLLVAEESDSRDTADGGSAGGDSDLPGGVDAGEAIAMEELESARRENAELNSRVDDLQDQVETLQRLLELKNSQLAEMQQMAGEGDAEAVAGEAGAPGEGEAAATASAEDAAEPGSEETGADEMSETVASATGSDSAAGEGEQGVAGAETDMAADEDVAAEGFDDAAQAAGAAGQAAADQAEADATSSSAESADATVADDAAAAGGQEPEEEAAAAPSQQQTQSAQQPPAPQKAFPGNIIDMIVNNPMYQIALGGGLILLLLLLLLLARRNANREKEFYDELNADSEGESDSFEVDLGEDEAKAPEAADALAEADRYVAYGQTDQAVQTLETAISREPSRTDLRLKLLALYADNQDRQGFEKQFGEIEAFEDEDALAEANALRSRLEEAESVPSIDDLESQLRSDSFGTAEEDASAETSSEAEVSDELLADQYDASKEEQVENEFGDFDTEFAEFDLSDVEQAEEKSEDAADTESEAAENRDDTIEFDLSSLETEDEGEPEAKNEETDFSSLEMDLEEPAEESKEGQSDEFSLEPEDEPGKPADAEGEEMESELSGLDESFLDELDAELDKVAGEDELGGDEIEESSLDDLELDVSDEDLALMEEFSDSADTTNHREEEPASLDEELGLEDTLGEGDVMGEGEEPSPEQEVAETEELEDLGTLENLAEQEAPAADEAAEEEIPVANEKTDRPAPVDIDESELGEDDDFDFLAGTDEAATKLDLARAYIEMGDSDGARDILEEVALEGDDAQKAEAQDLLKNLS